MFQSILGFIFVISISKATFFSLAEAEAIADSILSFISLSGLGVSYFAFRNRKIPIGLGFFD